MAETRRRKCKTNGNSDNESDDSEEGILPSNVSYTGSEIDNSEYESADEEELNIQDEELVKDCQVDHNEDAKQLDHDEDRKNPQYIPKKGNFYEHDDRNEEEIEVFQNEDKKTPTPKKEPKNVWKDDERWHHDRFNLEDQVPKSREELVAAYGYDIRNEEGAPRARRRRRYGRGPNKYTRNWEDLDAYSKLPLQSTDNEGAVRGARRGRRADINPKSEEEHFPSLPSIIYQDKKEFRNDTELHSFKESHQQDSYNQNLQVNKINSFANRYKDEKNSSNLNSGNKGRIEGDMKHGRGRGKSRGASQSHNDQEKVFYAKSNREYYNNYQEEDKYYPNRNRDDGSRIRSDGKPRSSSQPQHMGAHHYPKDIEEITSEFKDIYVGSSPKEDYYSRNKRGVAVDNRRNTLPPRLQETVRANKGAPVFSSSTVSDTASASKTKRYSSQRQRPIQDQIGQYHLQPMNFFEKNTSADSSFPNKLYERNNSSPNAAPATLSSQSPSFVQPSFTSAPIFPPQSRLFTPVTQPPHLIGPSIRGPVPGVPPIAGQSVASAQVAGNVTVPTVTGTPFLPPDNLINYAAGAPPLVASTAHPPQFPGFQAFPSPPVSQPQPQEIYSNGVMYYNTESQHHLPRVNYVLQKRPKAAIPILPPPERGDLSQSPMDEVYEMAKDGYESTNDSYHFDSSKEMSQTGFSLMDSGEYLTNAALESEIWMNIDSNSTINQDASVNQKGNLETESESDTLESVHTNSVGYLFNKSSDEIPLKILSSDTFNLNPSNCDLVSEDISLNTAVEMVIVPLKPCTDLANTGKPVKGSDNIESDENALPDFATMVTNNDFENASQLDENSAT